MNDVMSAGIHRLWKQHFVHQLKLKSGMKILDMAGGTGKNLISSVEVLDFVLYCLQKNWSHN